MNESKESLKRRTKGFIEAIANEANLQVVFKEGRRKSDIWMMALTGERHGVIRAATEMMNRLQDVDLELITSEQRDDRYKLSLVVTEKLDRQISQVPERRAKLRLMLQEEQGAK